MVLKEWVTHILRMRDMRKKEISTIDESSENSLTVTTKNSTSYSVSCSKKLTFNTKMSIYYCDNSQENVKTLYDNWQLFIKEVQTRITFVNNDGSFWTIIPQNHSKITTSENLLTGLQSLYNTSKL